MKINKRLHLNKTSNFQKRALLYPEDYNYIIKIFEQNEYTITNLRGVFEDASLKNQKVSALRHDVDHDYETALRMAEWEQQRGYKATYCVLHTAWYYGEFVDGRYHHFDELIDFCRQLEDMGHEINLHNNFGVLALQTGIPVGQLISNELAALRGYGLTISGSSTHGDAFCRDFEFFNLEIFKDRAWDSKGGSRAITHKCNQLELGSVCMDELDLVYEAYDHPRHVYVTDSGGRPRVRRNTRGIRGYRSAELNNRPPFESLCGVLTHPIWWEFRKTHIAISKNLFQNGFIDANVSDKDLSFV